MRWPSHFRGSSPKAAFNYWFFPRTPTRCYRESTKLVVELPTEECGRPRKAGQQLTNGATDILSCPLTDYTTKLDSYSVASSITWFRVSCGNVWSQL